MRRTTLPLLRAAAVLILGMMLAEPTLTREQTRERRGRLVVVVDRTPSMDVIDHEHKESRAGRAAAVAAGLADAVEADVEIRDVAGETTDLAAPLAGIEVDPETPTTVVLLSDGRDTNDPADVVEAAAGLAAAGASVHAVPVGGDATSGDVSVLGATGPAAVRFDGRVAGEVTLIDDLPAGRPFTLTATVDGVEVWRAELAAVAEGTRAVPYDFAVPASLRSHDAAEGLMVATFAAAAEGDAYPQNDAAALAIRVAVRPRSVLVLDGRPRWDTRYLVATLDRDDGFDVAAVPAGDLALLTLDFDQYDVIVYGDLDPADVGPDRLAALADFVLVRGGGIVFVDGDLGHLADLGPLAAALPVGRESSPPLPGGPFEATDADVLRVEPDAAPSQVWPTLPPPRRAYPATARPGVGETLATTAGRPVVARASIGRGRSYYLGTDETWRWRKGGGGERQSRLFSNLVAAAAESAFAAEDDQLAIGVDAAEVEAGSPVPVRARLKTPTADGESVVAEAQLLRDGQAVATAEMTFDGAGGGLLRGEIPAPAEPGVYEVAVHVERPSGTVGYGVRARVLVTDPAAEAEMRRLTADCDALAAVAAAGGGRVLEADAAAVAEAVGDLTTTDVTRRRYDLLAGWPAFAAVVGLLGAEWLARRRMGMM